MFRYFEVFDNDRSQLVHAYVAQATFSLCVNTTVSERTRRTQDLKPEQINKQKELTWGTYLGAAYESTAATSGKENLSRNFLRTKQSRKSFLCATLFLPSRLSTFNRTKGRAPARRTASHLYGAEQPTENITSAPRCKQIRGRCVTAAGIESRVSRSASRQRTWRASRA